MKQHSEPGRLAPGEIITDVNPAASAPRRRPRFSLLALIWLLTITALGVGLYRTGQEVVPLRASIARLRSELGYFPVADESKAYARRTKGKVPNAWQWRLFLPRGWSYAASVFIGNVPDRLTVGKDAWFDLLRRHSNSLGEQLERGEIGYEAVLIRYDNRWWIRVGRWGDEGQALPLPSTFEYLSDESGWFDSSDASYGNAREFAAGEPIVLLNVERNLRALSTESADALDEAAEDPYSTGGAAKTPRIVVWLDPGPP